MQPILFLNIGALGVIFLQITMFFTDTKAWIITSLCISGMLSTYFIYRILILLKTFGSEKNV